MDDFEREIQKIREEEERERQAFLQKALSKMTGEMAYQSLLMLICKRFKLDKGYYTPEVAYVLVDHFINNVDEPFERWIHKNDSPFVRKLSDAKRIFHEFSFLEDDEKIVELANKVYNLDLKIDYDEYHPYMYSLSFDFNSFTPINIDGIKELKAEISVLEKHGIDCTDLYEQLNGFGLTEEQLELI